MMLGTSEIKCQYNFIYIMTEHNGVFISVIHKSIISNQGGLVKNRNNAQSSHPALFTHPFRLCLPPRLFLPLLAPYLTLLLSPWFLPQQNYRGVLVVTSVFLQPGISTGQHSVRTLHSLCLPCSSHAHLRACFLPFCSGIHPD